ncbi:MAG: hypothetical protein M1820_010152 [Bogoriella megaspora]|nr:MAG: hypothetical protein M1820_010152 [Bogoriella megaspora]
MADVFSAATGAIGIISSSLTICQALTSYYESFTSFDREYNDTIEQVRDLRDLLGRLELVLCRTGEDDARLVIKHIERLKPGLQSLQEFWKSRLAHNSTVSKLREQGQRLGFPFKKSALDDLRAKLSSLRSNLAFLLQILDYGQGTQAIDLITTIDRNGREFMELSRSAHTDTNERLSDIQARLRDMQLRVQTAPSLFASVCTEVDRISACSDCNNCGPAENLPGRKGNLLDTKSSDRCTCRALIQTVHLSLKSCLFWSNNSRGDVRCPKHPFAEKVSCFSWKVPYCAWFLAKNIELNFSVSGGAGGVALPPFLRAIRVVPYDSPAFAAIFDIRDFTRNNEIRQAQEEILDLFRTRKAHPSDTCPSGDNLLTVMCKLLCMADRPSHCSSDLSDFIQFLLSSGVPINGSDVNGVSASQSLYACNGPYPFCPEVESQTAYGGAWDVVGYLTKLSSQLLENGADAIIPARVMNRGETLIQNTFLSRSPTSVVMTVRYLASLRDVRDGFSCGSLSKAVLDKDRGNILQILEHQPASHLEQNALGQSPLHLSADWLEGTTILLRAGANPRVFDSFHLSPLDYAAFNSNTDVARFITALDIPIPFERNSFATNKTDYSSLPTGSSRLLSKDEEQTEAWLGALSRLLLQAADVRKVGLESMKSRRRELHKLAIRHRPSTAWHKFGLDVGNELDYHIAELCEYLNTNGIDVPLSLTGPRLRTTVYHAIAPGGIVVDRVLLDELFDAGFRDIDEEDYKGLSPLHCIADSTFCLNFELWLVQKGAKLGALDHLNSDKWSLQHRLAFAKGEAVFYSSENRDSFWRDCPPKPDIYDRFEGHDPWRSGSGYYTADRSTTVLMDLIMIYLTNQARDSCNCSCALQGCSTLTAFLAGFLRERKEISRLCHSDKLGYLCHALICLFDKHPRFEHLVRNDLGLRTELVQYMTFTALGLTHTCCRSHQDPYFRRSEARNCELCLEEGQEIRSEEHVTITLLEDLMTEFKSRLSDSDVSLGEFLNGYWKSGIQELHKSDREAEEEELRKFAEIGVIPNPGRS